MWCLRRLCLVAAFAAAVVYGGDVTYDGRSLIINGQRKLLFSGSIHYSRSTPDMWPSLIKRAKNGGLDVIDTYVFWNEHEPQPGQFDFSGRRDIVSFIKEIQAHGLYACVRFGPYIQSEVSYGGFPFWLHDVPGIIFRSDNEPFKFHMQNFTTRMVNMLKSEKLFASQGGPIILSQIENEYNNVEKAFKEKGPPYVRWAAQMAVGLQTGVPWVMCKQIDAPDPIINSCNNMKCGELDFTPNSPNKPAIWTENWTSLQICNIVCASCKRTDKLRDKQLDVLRESLSLDAIETGTGLNQEKTLKRHGDTRWGSHYGALLSIISLFTPVIGVLGEVGENAGDSKQRAEALVALKFVQSFEFVFFLYFMRNVLGITNDLSQALQKKDQNIVNAMRLVDISKQRLQRMRDGGWDDLLEEVSLFCNQRDIPIPNMDEDYVAPGRSRRKIEERKNIYRYRVERFYLVLDQQLKELNDRFNEKNTELLLCVSCFDPKNSFERFNKKKLIQLAKFYPNDFSEIELQVLDNQLETYILDVSNDHDFSELVGIDKLAQKMVETGRHLDYTLVYLLLKLVLILPVATASVEKAFSAMKIIKTSLRNRMSDNLLNDCLIPYVENDIFDSVSNAMILRRFQNMRERRGLLPRSL